MKSYPIHPAHPCNFRLCVPPFTHRQTPLPARNSPNATAISPSVWYSCARPRAFPDSLPPQREIRPRRDKQWRATNLSQHDGRSSQRLFRECLDGPIFKLEVRNAGEVQSVSRDHSRVVGKRNRGDFEIHGAEADTRLA